MTIDEIKDHAYKYAFETAGAIHSVSNAYANHYLAAVADEEDPNYWPSHREEFWRWIKHQPINEWRK